MHMHKHVCLHNDYVWICIHCFLSWRAVLVALCLCHSWLPWIATCKTPQTLLAVRFNTVFFARPLLQICWLSHFLHTMSDCFLVLWLHAVSSGTWISVVSYSPGTGSTSTHVRQIRELHACTCSKSLGAITSRTVTRYSGQWILMPWKIDRPRLSICLMAGSRSCRRQ